MGGHTTWAQKKPRVLRQIQYMRTIKHIKGCVECGETNPIVLDFDHKHRCEKSFNIGRRASSNVMSRKLIDREIRKCQVLCVKCHRIRTAIQLKWHPWDGVLAFNF
jgi:hypothetical protein